MQKARGNDCIKKILTDIPSKSVVHENCCKPILTIENKYYYYRKEIRLSMARRKFKAVQI
jgi:hypothetical protein